MISKRFFRNFLYPLFASIGTIVLIISVGLIFINYFFGDKLKITVTNKSDSSKFSFIIMNQDYPRKILSPIDVDEKKIYKFHPFETGTITFKMQRNRGFAPIDKQIEGFVDGYIYGYGGSSNIIIFNDRVEIIDITNSSTKIYYYNSENIDDWR